MKNANAKKPTLEDFHFNKESVHNRYALDEAQLKQKHEFIEDHLSKEILVLNIDEVLRYNPMIVELDEIFDEFSWIQNINLNVQCLYDYDNAKDYEKTIMIIDNEFILGFLLVYIWGNRRIHNDVINLVIHAKAQSNKLLPISKVTFDKHGNQSILNVVSDKTLYEKQIKDVVFDKTLIHKSAMNFLKGEATSQMDGKQWGVLEGFAGGNAQKPCTECEVDRKTLNSFPTPENQSFVSRNLEKQLQEMKFYDGSSCIKSNGAVGAPIVHTPKCRRGLSAMHTHQGIFGKIMEGCFDRHGVLSQDSPEFLEKHKNLGVIYADAQIAYYDIEAKYIYLQDLQNRNDSTVTDGELLDMLQKKNVLLEEMKTAETTYETSLAVLKQKQSWLSYGNMLKKMKFKGNYIHKGMVEGHDCEKLVQNGDLLVKYFKEYDKETNIGDQLEYLLCVLRPLLHFTMSTEKEVVSDFHLTVLYRCSIDLLGIVHKFFNQFRETKGLSNKPHRMLHNVEQIHRRRMNTGLFNETRVENANQAGGESAIKYAHYKKYNQLAYVARDINLRTIYRK